MFAQATSSTMPTAPSSTHRMLPMSPTTSRASGRRFGASCISSYISRLNPGGIGK